MNKLLKLPKPVKTQQVAVPEYYKILPEQLREEADQLVSYLKYFPFKIPTACTRCGSRGFRKAYNKNKKKLIPLFFCNHCKKCFSQTTNSYFSGIIYLELLAPFAILRLTGYSQEQISEKLGFSLATAKERDKLLLKIMCNEYPKLYAWWEPHQNYQDNTMPPQVLTEKNFFINWLKATIKAKEITCPHCNKPLTNKRQGQKECGFCHYVFDLRIFTNHKTKKLSFDKWIPFVEELIAGKSGDSLVIKFNTNKPLITKWKRLFIKQMQAFKLEKLIHWMMWQRSREIAYQARQSRLRINKGSID